MTKNIRVYVTCPKCKKTLSMLVKESSVKKGWTPRTCFICPNTDITYKFENRK